VTLVAADDRLSRYRHPVPTANRWKDTLMLVTCAKRGGLIVSLSRIICSGEIPDELGSKTEAAAYVNARVMSATRPGTTGAELYEIAARAYAERGFANEINLHHQGGATGYKTREWVAHPKSTEIVKMNQAFAWNPSITGTKTEETGIVTDSGFEVVTATPGFPQIAVQVDGVDYFSPGILSLSKGASA
jgi:antitoxin VapB